MAFQAKLSGLDENQVIPPSELIKAYLPNQRSRPEWKERGNLASIYLIAGLSFVVLRTGGIPIIGIQFLPCGWLTPLIFALAVVTFPLFWWLSAPRNSVLPFDMPQQAGRSDPRNLDPKGRAQKADGHVFLGIESKTGRQVWLSNRKVVQHLMLPGTTGSGKTAMILGLMANALAQGSGVFLIDAKGDLKFMQQVFALARMYGRDADVRILNFLNSDPYVSESFNSNTFNMLSMAPADDISSLLSSMRASMGKDNQAFEGRSTALVSSVSAAKVWLRDNLGLPLSIVHLRDAMVSLDVLIALAFGCDENGVEYDVTPDFWQYSDAIWAYLIIFMSPGDILSYAQSVLNINIKGLKHLDPKRKKGEIGKFLPEQKAELQKQHGFAVMALTPVFQNMVGDYKRIFGCMNGDVTIDDAVKNRRIVIALLPSLGKSKADTLSASKILVSNIRGMTSRALGQKTYGMVKELVDNQITNANSPYLIVFEEAGPYVQEGMDQLYQQARGLNFWIVTAFQDIPGLERNDAGIARSIIGNANYPMFMRLQDPTFTGKLAREMGEQAYTSLIRSFEEKAGIFDTKRSVDSSNVSIERQDLVTFKDLQSQTVGQATIIAEGRVVRMNAFYCEPLSCVPAHRMNSYIRRFASWRPPLWNEITLVQTAPAPAGRSIGPATPLPAQSPPQLTNVTKTHPQKAEANSRANLERTKLEEALQRVQSQKPVFGQLPPPPDFKRASDFNGMAPGGRSVPEGVTPGLDLYSKFIGALLESQESRIVYEQQGRDFLPLQLEKPGPVGLWEEFLNMSFIGLEICAEPTATMDLATMTVGLIGLAGIRGRFRRDGKLPPYLPLSWAAKRSLQDGFNAADWSDVLGAEAALDGDLFSQFGAALDDNDSPPEPTYMRSSARHPFDPDELPEDDPDGYDEREAQDLGPGSAHPLADEIMNLLDRED